jgi:alpha-L-glutamate ligase-like protein
MAQALPILEKSTFLFQFVLGAFVVLVFSYIIGLKSYGFFSPMVIVISWLALGVFWGFMVFFVIFSFGIIIRRLISEYNLAYGFRIGILMISMIFFTALLEVVGETFRISFLTSNILLPIIIIPNYIDRYVMEVEEHSYLDANVRLLNTLLIVFFAWLIMSFQEFVYFVVVTPESWILFVFIFLIMGKNAKYTQFDKKRFRELFTKKDEPLTLLIRNRAYISKYNQKLLFSKVNKFHLKEQFEEWRVPSPELLGIINSEGVLPELMERIISEDKFSNGFVIKPSQSFGGRGILVVTKRNKNKSFVIGESDYHPIAIEKHIRSIIHGEFLTSLTGSENDIVIIEELVECYEDLKNISTGLPDIRVIVFRGIPVMAMARLPTKESGGKANLKQGAIGAGIDIKTGHIFRAQYNGNSVEYHPDTGNKIIGFSFNRDTWKEILSVACLAQKSIGLGYAGVDIVIDKNKNILVLEVNKRPGLEIQNINGTSILKRFRFIEDSNLEAYDLSPIKSANLGIELSEKYEEVKHK